MKYSNLPIKAYLNKVASKTPVPGGGSAAALFGAIGCALMEMVVNYSDKNKNVVKKSGVLLKKYKTSFLRLADEDIKVYKALSSACKKWKKDSQVLQKALKRAALVPLETGVLSCECIDLCNKLKKNVNKNLMSDVSCAKLAFACAFNSAKLNVDINIKYIKDKKFVNFARKKLKKWRRF